MNNAVIRNNMIYFATLYYNMITTMKSTTVLNHKLQKPQPKDYPLFTCSFLTSCHSIFEE